jgi:hypothetical protein
MARPFNRRRLIIRTALAVCFIALGFLMYRIGKEYEVFIDNETVTIDGERYEAVKYGSFVVDSGGKAADIWEYDRVIRKMTGRSHKFTVNILNEEDDSIIDTVERTVILNVDTRKWMVSLAAIANGGDNVFIPNPNYVEFKASPQSGDDGEAQPEAAPEF